MLMDRTEPALVPEWLRSAGNIAGGIHHSDASAKSKLSSSFKSNRDYDSPQYPDKSSAFDSRHNSNSNGLAKHPYSSFSRSHRDKKRDRDKGKPFSDDIWDHDSSQSLASMLDNRVGRSFLRHSQSLVSRKPGEVLHHKLEGSQASSTQKQVFEKDFPSLGKEKKQAVARTGLGLAFHILPVGNSGFVGGEKWTSALAEIPSVYVDNGIGHSSLQKTVVNMAEALSQPAVRTHETPQLPDKSHRLEELAIKQSRQLIPVTPSMPKPMVASFGDKSKHLKGTVRSSHATLPSRTVHPLPHPSHNQSLTGQSRHESVTPHVGKFLVLKSGLENGTNTTEKDKPCRNGNVNGRKIINIQQSVSSSSSTNSTVLRSSHVSALGNKAASLSFSSQSSLDKRTFLPLAQSRSEFFNLMRRKNPSCLETTHSDPSSVVSSAKTDIRKELCKEVDASSSSLVLENVDLMNGNTDSHDISEKSKGCSDFEDNGLYSNGLIYPDEEEVAFLRSLGWEENSGDDEGLTEEEINAFYQEYMRRTPTLKLCRGFQSKCSTEAKLEAVSSESTTSKSEA